MNVRSKWEDLFVVLLNTNIFWQWDFILTVGLFNPILFSFPNLILNLDFTNHAPTEVAGISKEVKLHGKFESVWLLRTLFIKTNTSKLQFLYSGLLEYFLKQCARHYSIRFECRLEKYKNHTILHGFFDFVQFWLNSIASIIWILIVILYITQSPLEVCG